MKLCQIGDILITVITKLDNLEIEQFHELEPRIVKKRKYVLSNGGANSSIGLDQSGDCCSVSCAGKKIQDFDQW